jgi:hypothetical protein
MTTQIVTDIGASRPLRYYPTDNAEATQNAAGTPPSFGKIRKEAITCYKPYQRPEGRVFTNQELREDIMNDARSSQEEGIRLAHSYAFESLTMPLVDVTDWDNIRYSGNGELITAESSAYYSETVLTMQKQRAALYRTEIGKGTPPAEVLEKILEFNDSLPPRFLDMNGW